MTGRKVTAALTQADLIRGRNGRAIYSESSRLPEDVEDYSREEINRAYRVRGD